LALATDNTLIMDSAASYRRSNSCDQNVDGYVGSLAVVSGFVLVSPAVGDFGRK
jgi:hypothetical protein